VQQLASGVGVLLLLWLLPGGLAQVFYSTRDAMLRAIAHRRGIVVPSLVADVRDADDGSGVTSDVTLVLPEAPAVTSVDDDDRAPAHSGAGVLTP
jgi:hypothetical protein